MGIETVCSVALHRSNTSMNKWAQACSLFYAQLHLKPETVATPIRRCTYVITCVCFGLLHVSLSYKQRGVCCNRCVGSVSAPCGSFSSDVGELCFSALLCVSGRESTVGLSKPYMPHTCTHLSTCRLTNNWWNESLFLFLLCTSFNPSVRMCRCIRKTEPSTRNPPGVVDYYSHLHFLFFFFLLLLSLASITLSPPPCLPVPE